MAISPDGSLLASGGRDGMIVLMTLFVPSLLPRSADTSLVDRKQRQQQRVWIDRSYIKDFNKVEEFEEEELDEDFDAEREAEELDSILTSTQVLTEQQKAIRLKRKSRAAVKLAELDDHATVRRKGTSAKSSRKKRTKGKAFDIPSMVAHLSASAKAYGPEEPETSEDSDDEQKRGVSKHKLRLAGGEGIVERMAKLKTPHDQPAKPPAKAVDKAEFGRLKKQFEAGRIFEEGEDPEQKEKEGEVEDLMDLERQFLHQGTKLPRSSTFDSSLTFDDESDASQYGVLSQQRRLLKTSIQFESTEDTSRRGLLGRLPRPPPSEVLSDQLSDISEVPLSISSDQKHGRNYQYNVGHMEGRLSHNAYPHTCIQCKPVSLFLSGTEESQGSRTEFEEVHDTEELFSFLAEQENEDDEDAVSMI